MPAAPPPPFEQDVIRRLEAAAVEYFVTGSVALGAWATFRQTNDIDIVVVLGRVWFSSPEDLVIAKLEFSDSGRSQRQMGDCRAIVRIRADLDWEYLERHASQLGLLDLLAAVR
jgi:hypothetical protein